MSHLITRTSLRYTHRNLTKSLLSTHTHRNYWPLRTHSTPPRPIHIEMNSNKVNAFSWEFFDSFNKVMDEIDSVHDKERPVVLTSSHRVFSAGLDLTYLRELQQREDVSNARSDATRYVQTFHDTLMRFMLWERPTVSFIDGPVVAGGFPLALAADFRVLDKKSSTPIRLHAVNLGLCFPSVVHFILRESLGGALATETMLLGREFSREDLIRLHIMKEGTLEDCDEMFAQVEPSAYVSVKKGLKQMRWDSFKQENRDVMDRAFVEHLFSEETKKRMEKALTRKIGEQKTEVGTEKAE